MPNFTLPPKPVLPLALPFGFPNESLEKKVRDKPAGQARAPQRAVGSVGDPVLLEDFVALIEKELGALSHFRLTTDIFVGCVNSAGVLRYYFQDLTESELQKIGVRRQGYWLRTLTGRENALVSIVQVAMLLHQSQV